MVCCRPFAKHLAGTNLTLQVVVLNFDVAVASFAVKGLCFGLRIALDLRFSA
jgi:hypothetical protein